MKHRASHIVIHWFGDNTRGEKYIEVIRAQAYPQREQNNIETDKIREDHGQQQLRRFDACQW